MYNQQPRSHSSRVILLAGLLLSLLLASGLSNGRPARASVPHLGYGFNVAAWDITRMQNMGFNWLKVFGAPGDRQPLNVLVRFDAQAHHLNNLNQFGNDIYQTALNNGANIEAYEIGNEVNLDASYGWGGVPPNAADYVTLLCTAYDRIKQADPSAFVISAGLAPTGRVQGNWNGHAGHNGLYQDEREFLREFIAAGGANCADGIGYHPYGFSADYDAEPDVGSPDPARNCTNGFCFRGVEKIYEIMQQNGLGDMQVWNTEFGWIVVPPDHCLNDGSWQGRAWQIVSEQRQADNLRGAFEYADAHMPWMAAMIVFNLNFNHAGYPECEQMRFYAVQDRPAETALRDMPKNPAALPPWLLVEPALLVAVDIASQQPVTHTFMLDLSNGGWGSTAYEVTAVSGLDLSPTIINPTGSLLPAATAQVTVQLLGAVRPVGTYEGELSITADPGTLGAPRVVPIELLVFEPSHFTYLPLAQGK